MNVYTVPEKRRQGIAGNVIKQIMDFGKTQNLDFLELKAAPMGYPLYKKIGFEDACSRCKEMNFNPSEEEINFVNDALRQFNDIPDGNKKFHLIKNLEA